jgi:hypothetical protein
MNGQRTPGAPWVKSLYLGYGAVVCTLFVGCIPLSVLNPELGAFRNWQIGLNAAMLLLLALGRGWAAPSFSIPSGIRTALWATSGLLFLSVQLTRFFSFGPNGYDFSIFDWMLYNTAHGNFGFSPIYGVNHFGVHASYVLLPLVPLHRLVETPLLLVTLNALALWAGVLPLWRLAKDHFQSEGTALLIAIAYLTNPWMGKLVDGGFRPENFYPLLGLAFALGWTRGKAILWAPALIGFLAIKEDAALYIAALAVASLMFQPERRRVAAICLAGSLSLWVINLAWLQPHFLRGSGQAEPHYFQFWNQYGSTPGAVALQMLKAPWRVVADVATSGWYKLFLPALLLPLASRLPMAAMLPAVVLLGTASYPAMRQYRAYYAAPMIPFLFWSFGDAYRRLQSAPRLRAVAPAWVAAAALAFPLFGDGYLRLKWPDPRALRALDAAIAALSDHPGTVCAQGVLFPHLPYRLKLEPLSPGCARQPNAVSLVNSTLDPFPYSADGLRAAVAEAVKSGRAQVLESGFAILREPNLILE